MVTFADLMALLFALFILILSFSDVDSDSFKRDAGPIAEAFNQPKPIVILNKEQSSKSRFDIPQQQPGQKTESTLDDYFKDHRPDQYRKFDKIFYPQRIAG